MNTALVKLLSLNEKPRSILGLMSGTSLDGLDIALCEISGNDSNTELSITHFTSIPYSDEFLHKIRPLFANPLAPAHEITKANAWIARQHAAMVLNTLALWNIDTASVDILASHGQTIFHAPNTISMHNDEQSTSIPNASASLQIGDGCHLAHITQILTVSDFRQKHIAALGEGAPLVPYADFLLFASAQENRILLNVGGIANYTYLPANTSFESVVSADSGPGNTFMDVAVAHAKQLKMSTDTSLPDISQLYDANGEFAAKGLVDQTLLTSLIIHDNALKDATVKTSTRVSKSTGQESYNLHFILNAMQNSESEALSKFPENEQDFYDLLATLTMFTASSISGAIDKVISTATNTHEHVMYISGGGVHNPVLIRNLGLYLPTVVIKTSAALGINPDAKEAALFAVLANQTIFGNSDVFTNNNASPSTCLGKISLP